MAGFDPPRGGVHWLSRAEMTQQSWGHAADRLFLGSLPGDASVRIGRHDDRHVVVIAGSRAGKSTTLLLPNLKQHRGSLLCIDPKGELVTQARRWRQQYGRTICLDPFNVTGAGAGDGWNPFADLKRLPVDLIPDEAAMVAEALILEDGSRDGHWVQAARNLVRALILFLIDLDEPPTLADLRQYLASGATLTEVLKMMAESPAFGGIVAGLGASILAMGDKERDGVISTAATQTGFLDSPGLRAVSSRSTFALADLYGPAPVSVFLVLPPGRMPTHHRWLRLFVTMALTAAELQRTPPARRVLWVLEELAALGHLRSLQAAAGYLAGYGVTLLCVLQDLPQLKAHYQDGWETFLGNSGLLVAFGNSDPTTTEYLSRRLGEIDVEVVEQRPTHADAMRRGDFGEHRRTERRPLLSPSEIERAFPREAGNALVLAAGQKPLVVNRVHWEKLT